MSSPRIVVCGDLDEAVAEYTAAGARLQATGPADQPDWAELTDAAGTLILDADPSGDPARYAETERRIPATAASLTISHETAEGWTAGRAGMAYRDLIPGRFGGAYIASHINVKHGGPVPDYVHHHDVAHQLIFCHRGWVRVVYQDQGEPFVMEPGDCVLQPPGIRHQVLETSDDLYVTEVTCPADHRTSVDHDLTLPTGRTEPERTYGRGQRFVRHISTTEPWRSVEGPVEGPVDGSVVGSTFEAQRTAVGDSTGGLAELRFLRPAGGSTSPSSATWDLTHDVDMVFVFVASGAAELTDSTTGDPFDRLYEGSSVAVPPGRPLALSGMAPDTLFLELKCRRP